MAVQATFAVRQESIRFPDAPGLLAVLSCNACPLVLSLMVFYQAQTGPESQAGFREALDTLQHASAKADIRLRRALG